MLVIFGEPLGVKKEAIVEVRPAPIVTPEVCSIAVTGVSLISRYGD